MGDTWGPLIIGLSDGTFDDTEEYLQDASNTNTLVIGGPGHPFTRWHVQMNVDFKATPVDNAIFSFYSTLSDGDTNWDTAPYYQLQLSSDTDPNRKSYIISGYHRTRISVVASGATDTHTGAGVRVRGF